MGFSSRAGTGMTDMLSRVILQINMGWLKLLCQ